MNDKNKKLTGQDLVYGLLGRECYVNELINLGTTLRLGDNTKNYADLQECETFEKSLISLAKNGAADQDEASKQRTDVLRGIAANAKKRRLLGDYHERTTNPGNPEKPLSPENPVKLLGHTVEDAAELEGIEREFLENLSPQILAENLHHLDQMDHWEQQDTLSYHILLCDRHLLVDVAAGMSGRAGYDPEELKRCYEQQDNGTEKNGSLFYTTRLYDCMRTAGANEGSMAGKDLPDDVKGAVIADQDRLLGENEDELERIGKESQLKERMSHTTENGQIQEPEYAIGLQ